jgi:hypothetical protein
MLGSKKWALLVAGTVLALGAGVAYATIPDNGGLIHGCYSNKNGLLRIVDSTACRTSETAINWNQQGVPGPPGPKGDTGATGASGPPGAAVATHVRSTGSVASAASGAPVPWQQLTGSSWTQKAGETNVLYGQVTINIPSACDGFGSGALTVKVDGMNAGNASTIAAGPTLGSSVRVPINFPPPGAFGYIGGAFVAPTADTPHTVTAQVTDSCGGAGQHFTFDSLGIDVVSVS